MPEALNYKELWAGEKGRDYRMGVYERQRAGGTKPLEDNPTIDEIKSVLSLYEPISVLEVGCGWGRILSQLQGGPYIATGCDVSYDMLALVKNASVFYADIASVLPQELLICYRGDVVFSRGVLHYLHGAELDNALCNMACLARKRVVLWERQEVLERVANDPHFECRPVVIKEE